MEYIWIPFAVAFVLLVVWLARRNQEITESNNKAYQQRYTELKTAVLELATLCAQKCPGNQEVFSKLIEAGAPLHAAPSWMVGTRRIISGADWVAWLEEGMQKTQALRRLVEAM